MGRIDQRRRVCRANTRTAGKDQAPGRLRAQGLVIALAGGAIGLACQPPLVPPLRDARGVSAAPPLPSPASPGPAHPESRPPEVATPAHSLGPTRAGRLEGGRALPADVPWMKATPTALRRGAVYGDESLVAALANAARRIDEASPGSVLWVGDLSLQGGGAFPPHASHTNGRDADLAFYSLSAAGIPEDTGAMRAVDASGSMSGTPLRFDAARNWRLVELLLRDPAIQVQWLFVATHVRRLLLDAAADAGADPRIIARAERVLQQPKDSSPHADHFHLRVYCDAEDRLLGCVDAPPFHPWVDRHEGVVRTWLDGLHPFLDLPGTEEFRFALDRIARVHATEALPALEALSPPSDPADAALLGEVIRHLRGRPASSDRWVELAPDDTPP